MSQLSALKRELRQRYLERRRTLGEEARLAASQAICLHIETWRVFQRSDVILTYLPMRGEVDLSLLLTRHPQKRWLAPRLLPERKGWMALHPYDPEHLVRHPFGMLEPSAQLPEIDPAAVHLALVPAVAYDRRGWRLGYGGGYFDRFLYDFQGVSLGVTYADLLLDELPHADHDVPVDWIVTETGIFRTGARV